MSKNKILLNILLLIIFGTAIVNASFNVSVISNENNILPWEEANFRLAVTNTLDSNQTIKYNYVDSVEWSLIFKPIYKYRTLKPHETIYTDVKIMPSNTRLFPKRYDFTITLESEKTNIKKDALFDVFLRDPNQIINYVPIVNIDADVPRKLDPRKEGTIKIKLNNLNRLNITDFTIELDSLIDSKNNQLITTNLKPLETKEIKLNIKYDNKTNPQTDIITIKTSIPSKNKTYTDIKRELDIDSYSKIYTEIEPKKTFLKTKTTITLYNDGNIENTYIYENPTTIFKQIFTKSEPKYEVKKNIHDHTIIYFETNLNPFETKEIEIIVNYRPFFIIFILLIIAVLIYYFERTPILIKKETRLIETNEGEKTRYKILLHVKNRTNKQIENLTVIDVVPKMLELEKNFAIGTMHPTKIIKNEHKGTVVKWQLPILEPHEERIISYQQFSKLSIIGTLKLPSALVKFKNKRGNISRSYSNNITSK